MNLGGVQSQWSEPLIAIAIGSLSVLIPYALTSESGKLEIRLEEIERAFVFVSDAGSVGAALLVIMITSVFAAIGFGIMQVGGFVAMLPELIIKKPLLRGRLRKLGDNQGLMVLFASAYTSFRLFSGFCGLFLFWTLGSLTRIEAGNVYSGILLSLGMLSLSVIFLVFARFSFDLLDWASEGKLKG